MEFREVVEFHGAYGLKKTAKALLVEIQDADAPVLFPDSQIDDRSEVWKEGDQGVLIVSQWIAERKGLL